MRRQRWWLPLLALVFTTSWKSTLTLPVPDEELDTSTKLLGSSVVTSVSVVTGSPEHGYGGVSTNADRGRVIPSKQLPGSPADLLRPDKFQFYTLNKDGDVVTKQMSQQEIQSLIAAGGGHLPMEIHEPQNAGEVPSGGMKVADVVQNVQNVLKGELSKPATVMTSLPTIPGHANTEWSSILPAILGGEPESAPDSDPAFAMITDKSDTSVVTDTTLIKIPDSTGSQTPATKLPAKEQSTTADYESKKRPSVMTEAEPHAEKPMIQVPVITVDQKLPAHQDEEDSMPIFQMLNTISADKINAKNNTKNNAKPEADQSEITDLPAQEEIAKPEKVTIKPIIQEPSIVPSSSVDSKLPEMVEINQTLKKPTETPNLMTLTTNVISKVPQTEPPASVSVISETHSTSMKVSGQEEIPLREPSKPMVQPVNPISLPPEEQKPVATEKPIIKPATDVKLDSTTVKAESSVTPADVSATVTSEKPGLIAQGVSFIENLPQAVSDIVTVFISNNSPNSKPMLEEIDPMVPLTTSKTPDESPETESSAEKPQSTQAPSTQTTPTSNPVTDTTKKPDQEPVYQIIPEIIPNKRIQPQGASPSEASSIEHIIETLSDPTGSMSGTVAADHYGNQADDPAKPLTVSETQASTTATPINVETTVETSSAKPMGPLPTELADSLSSMISQISDAMPSVLPVSENAGLDTTEKKNVIDMQAEEPSINETKTKTEQVPMGQDKPANKIQLPSQSKVETPAVLPTKAPENQDPIIAVEKASETVEKLIEIPSTTLASVNNESANQDSSTTVKSDLALIEIVKTDVPVNKIDETEILTNKKPDVVLPNPQKVIPETDAAQASSEIATDKINLAVATEASVVPKDSTLSVISDAEPVEQITTEKSATTASSSTSVATVDLSDGSGAPPKVQANSLPAPEALKPEIQQNDSPPKDVLNENNTEMPMIHINITEAKPTEMVNANTSQEIENQDNGTESPLVRIQLTDPVTLINNMINSAKVNASAGSVVPLTLPETGSVPPNNIASGLIAGFPSSTTQATPETNPTTTAFVLKSQPKIQPVVNTFVNSTTADVQTDAVQSDIKTNDSTPEVTEVKLESSATEKAELLEVSTLKDTLATGPEVTLQTTESPMETIVSVNPELEATIQSNVIQQISTEMPPKEESIDASAPPKGAEVEMSSTTAASEAVSNDSNVTKLADKLTPVLNETTTEINTASNAETTMNETKASIMVKPEHSASSDEIIEASKIVVTTISESAMPYVTTEQTDSSETKIPDATTAAPKKSVESTNITLSEVPVVRIDVAPEIVSEEMPTKIQLDDLPIVETTTAVIKPMDAEKIKTQSSEPATTVSSSIGSTANSDDSLQVTAASTTEKIAIEIGKDQVNFEEVVKQEDKTEGSAGSDPSEKITETATPISMFQQTEEVRIQVNNTAVLVTKRPVSESSGQTIGDIQKTTANQPIDAQSTTPKVAPITEEPFKKLGDKEERLTVPMKINELLSNNNAASANTLNNSDSISSSGTENRIRLGDEQGNEESIKAKVEDTRKPIKKNSDSDSSESYEGKPAISSTTKISPAINNKDSALQNKNIKAQPSIKVELTTIASSDKPSKISEMSPSSKLDDKPIKLNDKKSPTKVADGSGSKPSKPSKPAHKPTMNIKKDDAIPGPADEKWTLIPQQVYPALTKTGGTHDKRPTSTEQPSTIVNQAEQKVSSSQQTAVSLDHPQSASGLDSTVQNLETDISYFANLCNELAFTFWTATNKGLSTSRSLAVSPFGMTSMLAMVFLGARGPTSDQMNDILKLDDVSSFNPHLVFQNVTDAVGLARNQGIANAAFVRELFADRSKVRKLMPFYKEQAQQFYDGIVAEVNFATISDLVRRRTNLMIRKQTGGRIKDFVRTNTVPLRSPLAAMSANVFQTDCNSSAASSEGRDGELYFAVSPAVRQRKLVPVPATVWRAGILAGYEPSLDATAIALGGTDKLVSTIFVIPGQQGHTAPGDSLDHLEQRFIRGATHGGAWNKLLKVLIPRPSLELQVPKFSHRSVINATAALKRMGLEELFSKHADLKGINGIATDLHLADVLQMNLFSTCGDENILSGRHHVEVYPGSPSRNARAHSEDERDKNEYSAEEEVDEVLSGSEIPYETASHRETRSTRQTESTEAPRLKLDRPFLFFVRHNPTGLILHMGRFNPRLLP